MYKTVATPLNAYGGLDESKLDIEFKKLDDAEVNPILDF